MTRAVRSLLAALLVTLLGTSALAQSVDQQTYDLMVRTRDQVSEAINDIAWEQQALLDHYRNPDWIIYDTGDGILTLDLGAVEEQARMLQLWLMIPGTRDIALSALRRSHPELRQAIVAAERVTGDEGPGGVEGSDARDIVERLRQLYEQSVEKRAAAFELAMGKLEHERQELQILLDFMDAELRKLDAETTATTEPVEPDSTSCVLDGENAIDVLCSDEPVGAGDRWTGDWQTEIGLLRLVAAGDGFEGSIESGRGVARVEFERQETAPGDPERLVGWFHGPVGGRWLPELTAERYGELAPMCPEGADGETSWGEIYLYGFARDEFGGWWAPCDEPWRVRIDHANFTHGLSGRRIEPQAAE